MTYKKELLAFLQKLRHDEPIFILRAQDCFAAATVRDWADKVDSAHGGPTDKTLEARAWADEMDRWPTKKIPD